MLNTLNLKRPVAENSAASPADIMAAKQTLMDLGLYESSGTDVTEIPDRALFDAIRTFQKGTKLRTDGVMKPGGETETSLKTAAELVRRHGRYGDTILAHITPAEAELLHRITDGGSINPETGLPEFFIGSALGSLASGFIGSFAGPAVGSMAGSAVSGLAGQAVGNYVSNKISKKIRGPFGEMLGSAMGGYLGNGSHTNIAGGLGAAFGNAAGNYVSHKVGQKIGGPFGSTLGNALGNSIGGSISNTFSDAFGSGPKAQSGSFGDSLGDQLFNKSDIMDRALTPGINPSAEDDLRKRRRGNRRQHSIEDIGLSGDKPEPKQTPIGVSRPLPSKTNTGLQGVMGSINNPLTGEPIQAKNINITQLKTPQTQTRNIPDHTRQMVKRAQMQTRPQTMEVKAREPELHIIEGWSDPVVTQGNIGGAQPISAEAESSNARMAKTLSKTRDFSAIKPHVQDAWNTGGEKGKAEVVDLIRKIEERNPGAGHKLIEEFDFTKNNSVRPVQEKHQDDLHTHTKDPRNERTKAALDTVENFVRTAVGVPDQETLDRLSEIRSEREELFKQGKVKEAATHLLNEEMEILAPHMIGAGPIKYKGRGPVGPKYTTDTWKETVSKLRQRRTGEVTGGLYHPDIGKIDVPWGEAGTGHSDGWGLSKLLKHHPRDVERIPAMLSKMKVVSKSPNRIRLKSPTGEGAIRLELDGKKKTWLLTVFTPDK
ncbi:MAG: hypothetical protein OQK24_04300 [Magnetovibrio sp.]|nr:hypothetical protein [Magnetovibrio sp.]